MLLKLTRCYVPAPSFKVAAAVGNARLYSTPADVPGKSKVWASADEAVKDIKSGSVLLCAGNCQLVLNNRCLLKGV